MHSSLSVTPPFSSPSTVLIILIYLNLFIFHAVGASVFLSRLPLCPQCLEECLECNRYSVNTECGEGNGTPLQYFCLENPIDGGACRLQSMGSLESDMTERLHFHALEKEMAIHSSVLTWRIPGTGEPGGLLSMGSHRVGHD